ncbi:hypothetical protein D8674_041295 [Pyrus ussuriensis x Pyrus communis]|uniref:Uncharacterized protein n=1 Tax=Pyrus ussuriensis x Pyrus communis TaxID=2448454 RepID=A0A5N5GZ33_9ROSA|nr:hypothetical protein D8674_041295 [Pyrus ussuriensis x Pyrus communis]
MIWEHHICIGLHEELRSEYRVWEWHGHIMLFDEENGYTPEYIYGNYFEGLIGKARGSGGGGSGGVHVDEPKKENEEDKEKVTTLGLTILRDNESAAVGIRVECGGEGG